jgi:hypothetical protein
LQVQSRQRVEHRVGFIALELVAARVQQPFAYEVFFHERSFAVGERDFVSGEAREAGGDALLEPVQVACRAAVGDDQTRALHDELLLMGERFQCGAGSTARLQPSGVSAT